MIFNAMPFSFKLLAGLAFGAFCGCSAESGSSTGMGTGGHAGSANNATGGAGGSGSNTGGSGGNVSNVSVTTDGNNHYTLQVGSMKMVIDAGVGARITEFSLNDTNVLTAPAVDQSAGHNNYGCTFWTSPQAAWSWPPVAALDSQAYSGVIDAATNSVELVSGTATISNTPLTVTKRFVPVPESGAIDVTYTITNLSSSLAIKLAPWQISRVAGTGGLTFFAKGTGTYTSTGTLALTDADGIYWFTFAAATVNSKALSDGAGWIAHVTKDKLLLLFEYPDIQATEAAPNEAEVEVYTGPNGDYVEVEPQGAYTSLEPGATREWKVRWKLRQIDSSTTVSAGSASLQAFAQQQRNQ